MTWLLANWRLIGFLAVLGALGVQSYRLLGTQDEFKLYKQEQEAQEHERQQEDARRVAFDRFNQRKSDEDYRAALARIPAAGVRVDPVHREAVPAAAPGVSEESTVCFDRGVLNREIAGYFERLAARLSGIAREGEEVAAAYRSCRGWALAPSELGGGSDTPGPVPPSADD